MISKKIKKIILIVMGIMMFTIFSSFLNFFFGSSMSPKRKLVHQITSKLSKNYKTHFGINFMGISEEAIDGKYKRIGLELSYHRILSKDEGRCLLLKVAHDTLEAFNSHPEFEQYMKDVPFTNNNIIINIYIRRSKGPDVNHPDIGTFSFYSETLWYVTYKPDGSFPYRTAEKESFEAAKKIVESQQAKGYNDLE
jgi:hypothetical protein